MHVYEVQYYILHTAYYEAKHMHSDMKWYLVTPCKSNMFLCNYDYDSSSVGDLDQDPQDPHVFGPPESVSVSQR